LKVLVATSLYEAARPYLGAWIKGVRQAAQGHEVEVLAAVDGLQGADLALTSLGDGIDVHLTEVSADDTTDLGGHISSVRSAMLAAAVASRADVVVFCDADDVLAASAIGLHMDALEHADVSVGDLEPIDVHGRPLGTPMLGSALPEVPTAATLADTNVCGFSNTAVHRRVLSHVTGSPLPPVIATDWWVFAALLDAGCRARRANGTVALYRQHANNLLGSRQAVSPSDGAQRLQILARHHRARGDAAKAEIAERLASSPELLRQAMASAPAVAAGPWHAEAAAWCRAAMETA
jgi:hypothetical protein